MAIASPGQIYLADQRGIAETIGLSRMSTFNFGKYIDESRKPFGDLRTLNDEFLGPGHTAVYQPEKPVWVIILPITGEVSYQGTDSNNRTIDVGQVVITYATGGDTISLTNSYNTEIINTLYLEIAADQNQNLPFLQKFNFDFDGNLGTLIPIGSHEINNLRFKLSIGMFNGRSENLYQLGNQKSKFFAFVIAGAFELQGRLMHQRDGLALWDVREADMEALSNNAVILVLELT